MGTVKNADYTQSAINLTNPPEVKELYAQWYAAQAAIERTELIIRAKTNELQVQLEHQQQEAAGLLMELKAAIQKHGSYQDVEAGHYAVQQVKRSPVYHVGPFKEHFAKHVGSVVEETVNRKALEGLVKGGLIQQGDLEVFRVVTYDQVRAFIIK